MKRRAVLAGALALATTLASRGARAGTYVDSVALLLDETRRSIEWVEKHITDRHVAELAQRLAEGRVKAGRALSVPHEVEKAHPHLLLALETIERSFAAASEGDAQRFLRLVTQARDEERLYREILAQLQVKLPELDKRG